MIIDHRTYQFRPLQAAKFIEIVENQGMDVIGPMMNHMKGFFVTEIGRMNEVVHIYAYESFEQRTAVRAEVAESPGFPDFAAKVTPLLLSQDTKILKPVSFSPIR